MSYDATLATDRDKVRFNTGDTLTNTILADDTIDALLAAMSFERAVRGAARAMIAVLSKRPDEIAESGGVSQKWKERIPALQDLADGKTAIVFGTGAFSAPMSGQIELEGADEFR